LSFELKAENPSLILSVTIFIHSFAKASTYAEASADMSARKRFHS